MTWRDGQRETIGRAVDPLHPTEHKLTVRHRERFEEQVREKHRRLFGLNH